MVANAAQMPQKTAVEMLSANSGLIHESQGADGSLRFLGLIGLFLGSGSIGNLHEVSDVLGNASVSGIVTSDVVGAGCGEGCGSLL